MFTRYFQDELVYLRELGRDFAKEYPALAPMLAERSGDPDVERLLEGVAFLTARIRQKLDDELPEVIHGVAEVLFPDYVRPVAAAAILEIVPLPSVLRERAVVAKGSEFGSVPVDDTPCRFTSTRDCELHPWVIEDARLEPIGSGRHELRIDFRVPQQIPIATFAPEALRLHFAGESRSALALLAWVLEHGDAVTLRTGKATGGKEGGSISLPKSAIRAVGFDETDTLAPLSGTSFPAFRVLEDYYTLPAKFAFVDIVGVGRVTELDPKASQFSLSIRFDTPVSPDIRVTKDAVKLHCVPVVNVFSTTAEPIRLVEMREEYLVRPAGLLTVQGEVYAVLSAQAIERGTSARIDLKSFYDFSFARSGSSEPFFATHMRPSVVGDGADTTISFATAKGGSPLPDADVVSLDLLATNRGLASALRPGEISQPTPTSPAFATFRNLSAPTPHVSPPLGREMQWRVIAHASMGLRQITNVEVLRAALDLYNRQALVDAQAARANELRVNSVTAVRMSKDEQVYRGGMVRGVAIEVDLEERGFGGVGDLFLFGAVLDRFFGSYVSINAYARTAVLGLPSKRRFSWPPRNGSLTLI